MRAYGTLIILALSAALTVAAPVFAPETSLVERQSDLQGFDISQPKSAAFWPCMAKLGYNKVAIRGYQQACKVGGMVDKNFEPAYQAATQAGITNVDAYLFPCTGTQKAGRPACKSPSDQLAEFEQAISGASMTIGTRWFDIEPGGGPCNAWNLGNDANLALAQEWVQLLTQSGNTWGIYANGNEWTRMFATRDTDIGANSLPLWAVQADGKPGVSTVTRFMAGWTTAAAKQYKENLLEPTCKGKVDLASFSS